MENFKLTEQERADPHRLAGNMQEINRGRKKEHRLKGAYEMTPVSFQLPVWALVKLRERARKHSYSNGKIVHWAELARTTICENADDEDYDYQSKQILQLPHERRDPQHEQNVRIQNQQSFNPEDNNPCQNPS